MELELKILKEKVVEDEKKSGIGSLFDDEKTSHQHIHLLKIKYQEMRRNFDKITEELQKRKIEVMGDQLVLDSQIRTLQKQQEKMQNEQNDWKLKHNKIKHATEQTLTKVRKAKNDIEKELRLLNDTFKRESDENYKFKLTIDNNNKFGELNKDRHNKSIELLQDMLQKKNEELQKILDDRAKAEAAYQGMGELQGLIKEANDINEQIEKKHVELEHFQVTIKGYEAFTEYLLEKKERYDEDKKHTDETNEDLDRQVRTKEETAQKRIISKLQKDRNPEIKELVLKEEDQQTANEDFAAKHRTEVDKTNTLIEERLKLEEDKRLMT